MTHTTKELLIPKSGHENGHSIVIHNQQEFQGQSEKTRASIEKRSYEVMKSILEKMSSFRENVESLKVVVHEDVLPIMHLKSV